MKAFHAANYIGPNFVVAASGNIDHSNVISSVEKAFGKVPSSTTEQIPNSEKPYFTPSTLYYYY